jgi:hypothetical protein
MKSLAAELFFVLRDCWHIAAHERSNRKMVISFFIGSEVEGDEDSCKFCFFYHIIEADYTSGRKEKDTRTRANFFFYLRKDL